MREAPSLPTARLLLRSWRDADKPAYARLNADADVMEHFPSTLTATQSDEMVDRLRRLWDERGYGGWAVERLDTGECIGTVMLLSPIWDAWFTPCVEIGWRFDKANWGHGFAPEAARAAASWAFADVELPNDELVSFTTVQNTKSRRVMEKLGFTHDPADDFDHPLLDGWVESRHVLYRMSRERWESGAAD